MVLILQRGQHPRAVNIQQISTSKQSGAALRTSLQMDVVNDPAHWVPQAWFETGATLITSSPLFNTMDGRPSESAEVIDDAGVKGGLFGIHTCCIHYRPSIWMIQSITSAVSSFLFYVT